MGWKDVAPNPGENQMSPEQRKMILSLREQFDGAPSGAYSNDHLPPWTKQQARAEIDKLQTKIKQRKTGAKKPGKPQVCMACFSGVPHSRTPRCIKP